MNPEHLPKPIHTAVSFLANCVRHSPKFAWLHAHRFKGLTSKQVEYCVSCMFRDSLGYPLNLSHPKSLNEKLQWLNLRYHDPLIQTCADKIKARDFIAQTVGNQYLVPLIGVYNSADEIDFSSLPNKFALKVNWGSGQNIICTDKKSLDIPAARRQLNEWMRPSANHYYDFFEWCYKDITPQIIAEEFIEYNEDLPDYKFFCYNGNPLNMFIAQNRNKGHDHITFTFFSNGFKRLPIKQHYPTNDAHVAKPAQWDEMLDIAKKLSSHFPFVRVDFYIDASQRLKIGELTFCHFAGLTPFEPREWDYRLGELLKLPISRP